MSEACCGNLFNAFMIHPDRGSASRWACLSWLSRALRFATAAVLFFYMFSRCLHPDSEREGRTDFQPPIQMEFRRVLEKIRQKIWLPATDPTLLIIVGLTFTIKSSVDGHDLIPDGSHIVGCSNLTLYQAGLPYCNSSHVFNMKPPSRDLEPVQRRCCECTPSVMHAGYLCP